MAGSFYVKMNPDNEPMKWLAVGYPSEGTLRLDVRDGNATRYDPLVRAGLEIELSTCEAQLLIAILEHAIKLSGER